MKWYAKQLAAQLKEKKETKEPEGKAEPVKKPTPRAATRTASPVKNRNVNRPKTDSIS